MASDIHRVDTDVRRAGYLGFSIGVAFVGGGAGLIVFATAPFPGGLLFTVGLAALGYGARLMTGSTVGATVEVDKSSVTLNRGRQRLAIRWADVDHWGLAYRRVFGGTSRFNRLVLWPTSQPSLETAEQARSLWDAHHQGWALTTFDPSLDLLDSLGRHATCPRRDALGTPEW